MSVSWLKLKHLERQLGQPGQQVGAGRVVVINPHQPIKRLEDARQVGRGQRVKQLGGEHAGDIVQQQDPLHPADGLRLGAQPGDDSVGQDVQHRGNPFGLALQRHHQLGDAEQPAGHRVRAAAATMRTE